MVRLFGCTLRAQLVRRVPALCACTVSALGVCHAHDQLTAPPVRCEKAQSSVLSASFIADAAARASPALVNIAIMHYGQQHSSGSGFIVDPAGLILTNTHVVREAAAQGGAVRVTLSDGATLRGVVETSDAVSDIAIVRVQPSAPLPSVTLGKSENLRPGEFVIALGAPLGLSNSVSFGIVSAVERSRTEIGLRDSLGARNTTAYIQTDAAINSGNSGGPLLNIEGEVIGVNTMKALGMDGIAFAVPIDEVKRVVDQLQRHGRVLRPYLGLKFVELNSSIAAELNSRGQGGAVPSLGLYVMHVTAGSPAYRAGIRVGDTIQGIDGAAVSSTKDLIERLSDQVGKRVALTLHREGSKRPESLSVMVDSMHS